jgi:hypothetical protein
MPLKMQKAVNQTLSQAGDKKKTNTNTNTAARTASAKSASSKPNGGMKKTTSFLKLTPQDHVKESLQGTVPHQGGFFTKFCCSCLGAKKKSGITSGAQNNEFTDEADEVAGESSSPAAQNNKGVTPSNTNAQNPVTVNVYTATPPTSTEFYHDPVRSIRISPADIPRVQSRMNG